MERQVVTATGQSREMLVSLPGILPEIILLAWGGWISRHRVNRFPLGSDLNLSDGPT
jgi:hypothetical protein